MSFLYLYMYPNAFHHNIIWVKYYEASSYIRRYHELDINAAFVELLDKLIDQCATFVESRVRGYVHSVTIELAR